MPGCCVWRLLDRMERLPAVPWAPSLQCLPAQQAEHMLMLPPCLHEHAGSPRAARMPHMHALPAPTGAHITLSHRSGARTSSPVLRLGAGCAGAATFSLGLLAADGASPAGLPPAGSGLPAGSAAAAPGLGLGLKNEAMSAMRGPALPPFILAQPGCDAAAGAGWGPRGSACRGRAAPPRSRQRVSVAAAAAPAPTLARCRNLAASSSCVPSRRRVWRRPDNLRPCCGGDCRSVQVPGSAGGPGSASPSCGEEQK